MSAIRDSTVPAAAARSEEVAKFLAVLAGVLKLLLLPPHVLLMSNSSCRILAAISALSSSPNRVADGFPNCAILLVLLPQVVVDTKVDDGGAILFPAGAA